MTIRTYERLQCPFCPGSRFLQVLAVEYHADHGVTQKPDVLRCVDCQCDVDLNRMIDMHRMKKEQAELKARQQELDTQYAHVAAPAKPEAVVPVATEAGGAPKDAHRSRR